MSSTSNPYRLARTVVPSAYRIFLTPDLEAATFTGRVEIDVDVRESVDEFALHAIDLELGAATLTAQGASHRSSEPAFNTTYETATFAFDSPLTPGKATIEI